MFLFCFFAISVVCPLLSGVVRTARLAQFLEPSSAEPWRSALPRQPGMLAEPGMRAAIKYWDSAQISADFKWAAWQASEAAVVRVSLYNERLSWSS